MPDYDWREEERERERWEREGTPPRHRLERQGRDRGRYRDDDYSEAAAIYQERSFQPFRRSERSGYEDRYSAEYRGNPRYDRPRVFGERETGVSYGGGPRYGQGGYSQSDYSEAGVGGGQDYGRQGFARGYGPQGRYDQPSVQDAGYGQGGFGPTNFRQGDRDRDYGYGGYGIGAEESHAGGDRHEHRERHQHHEDGAHWWDRAAQRVERWMGNVDRERDRDYSYRGRGPKGYSRSDDRIRDDAHDRLTEDHWIDASEIEVIVANGEVTLNGTVDSRQAKHHAEHCVEDISGVRHVQNNLRVQSHGGRDYDPRWGNRSGGGIGANPILEAQAEGHTGAADLENGGLAGQGSSRSTGGEQRKEPGQTGPGGAFAESTSPDSSTVAAQATAMSAQGKSTSANNPDQTERTAQAPVGGAHQAKLS